MASSSVDALLQQLRKGLESILADAREEGRREVRSLLSGIVSGSPRSSGRSARGGRKAAAPAPKVKAPKGKKKRKSPWDRMSDDEFIARVNAIRKGRQMAPLTAAEAAEKIAERHGGGSKKKKSKKRKSAWDTYTPEQRKSHLEALKAGRKKAAAKRKRKTS